MKPDHPTSECPFLLFSANVANAEDQFASYADAAKGDPSATATSARPRSTKASSGKESGKESGSKESPGSSGEGKRTHFDYCAPVWDGLSFYLCEKLQKLQNRAARVILQANCEINSSLLLETLKWDKLSSRRRKQKAIMMFKSLNGLAPVYVQDLFSERNTDYDLRDAFRKLNLPKPRTDYLKRSFGYSGALLWNSLPENIRAIRSIGQFKKEINRALKTSDSHSAIFFF